MSLRIVSSDSADDLTAFEAVGLIRRQLGIERQRGHADDAVHRRPDLVAHVRQELALRLRFAFSAASLAFASSCCAGARSVQSRMIVDEADRPAIGVAIERHRLLE